MFFSGGGAAAGGEEESNEPGNSEQWHPHELAVWFCFVKKVLGPLLVRPQRKHTHNHRTSTVLPPPDTAANTSPG